MTRRLALRLDRRDRLLTAAMGGGANVSYLYDPMGRRAQKDVNGTVTEYLHDGTHVIAEYDGSGAVLRRYVHGPGTDRPIAMVEGAAHSYYHADRLGSVVALTDDSGAPVAHYTYDAYGIPYLVDPATGAQTQVAAGQPYLFTGRRFDFETGLYYYRARYYSASLGRFLQTDPIGYEDQMNLYAYVGNDPVNLTDPSGKNGLGAYLWAKSQVGSTKYQYGDPHKDVLGRSGSWFGGRWSPKCNVFVADALEAGGDPVTQVNGESRVPVASEWGDRTSKISGYSPLGPDEKPMRGDVVSDGEHVGIFAPLPDGSPGTISAASPPKDRVVHNDWGFRDGGKPVTIWRANSDRMRQNRTPRPSGNGGSNSPFKVTFSTTNGTLSYNSETGYATYTANEPVTGTRIRASASKCIDETKC